LIVFGRDTSLTRTVGAAILPTPTGGSGTPAWWCGSRPSLRTSTDAHGSIAIQKLNPFRIFPSPDTAIRAFTTAPHLVAQGAADLTAKEFYLLVLAADMGVNYYARENNPHLTIY